MVSWFRIFFQVRMHSMYNTVFLAIYRLHANCEHNFLKSKYTENSEDERKMKVDTSADCSAYLE
jgi:hypothetical protein